VVVAGLRRRLRVRGQPRSSSRDGVDC